MLNVASTGPGASPLAGQLPSEHFEVVVTDPAGGSDQAQDLLRRAGANMAVVSGPTPAIYIDGADLFSASRRGRRAISDSGLPEPTILFNPDLKTSTIMVPAIIGLILVFVGTIATSLGVVRERQTGTLETLAVMPLRPRDVFLGKIAPYFTVAVVDMVIVVAVGLAVFGVPFRGDVLTFGLGAALFLFVTTGLGVLISTVSQNQGQAIQLALMTLLPQILLSGMVFPLASMPIGVRWISYLLPLTYFIQIARGVLVRGTPIDGLVIPLVALAVMATLVFGLSVLRFRRDLAPVGQGRPKSRRQRPPRRDHDERWGVGTSRSRRRQRRPPGRHARGRSREVVAVVGGDGSGKTTLLRALVGAIPASAGSVDRPPQAAIGYVSANPGGYGDLTVDENLDFAARVYGVPGRERGERIEAILRRTQLGRAETPRRRPLGWDAAEARAGDGGPPPAPTAGAG